MKLKVFDVIELQNGSKGTILECKTNTYKVEIVNEQGVTQEIKNITESDIKSIQISKT